MWVLLKSKLFMKANTFTIYLFLENVEFPAENESVGFLQQNRLLNGLVGFSWVYVRIRGRFQRFTSADPGFSSGRGTKFSPDVIF